MLTPPLLDLRKLAVGIIMVGRQLCSEGLLQDDLRSLLHLLGCALWLRHQLPLVLRHQMHLSLPRQQRHRQSLDRPLKANLLPRLSHLLLFPLQLKITTVPALANCVAWSLIYSRIG